MIGEISIANATTADLPSLESLILELYATMNTPPDADTKRAVENLRILLEDYDHHILVAKVAGSAVGFINSVTRRLDLSPGF